MRPTKTQLQVVKLACEQVILEYKMGVPCKDYTPAEQDQRVKNARKSEEDDNIQQKEEVSAHSVSYSHTFNHGYSNLDHLETRYM